MSDFLSGRFPATVFLRPEPCLKPHLAHQQVNRSSLSYTPGARKTLKRILVLADFNSVRHGSFTLNVAPTFRHRQGTSAQRESAPLAVNREELRDFGDPRNSFELCLILLAKSDPRAGHQVMS